MNSIMVIRMAHGQLKISHHLYDIFTFSLVHTLCLFLILYPLEILCLTEWSSPGIGTFKYKVGCRKGLINEMVLSPQNKRQALSGFWHPDSFLFTVIGVGYVRKNNINSELDEDAFIGDRRRTMDGFAGHRVSRLVKGALYVFTNKAI